MSFATEQIARIETLLVENPGVKSVVVGNCEAGIRRHHLSHVPLRGLRSGSPRLREGLCSQGNRVTSLQFP
jgi:hypothetical protein